MAKVAATTAEAPVMGLDGLGQGGLEAMTLDSDNVWRERSQSLGQLTMEATSLKEQDRLTAYSEQMSVTFPIELPEEIPDPSALFEWLKYVLENQISASRLSLSFS
jgi:hypothetical protein